ncbi:MAG: ThiF family adenylyltransferase [Sterolibacteriaceae bacterium]|nr:ThiF family adenylyltransferase [Candidatus Methylophosphatis haderslevensis]
MTAGVADRYSRHRAIAGFFQERLQAMRVAVFGAGAIGNEVVKNLCLLGVGAIDLYDFDSVELHNLTRSILLRAADIGQPKAQAVAARAAAIDPNVALRALPGDLRDTLGPATAAGYDVAIGALDNFEARLRVNRLCRLAGRPWVNAAIDSRHASVESFPFGPHAEVACYECGLPDSVYARLAERQSCGGLAKAARAERIVPTTAITASLAAARAVQQALTLPPDSRRWLIDSEGGAAAEARIARRPDCPGCSEEPPAAIERRPGDGAPITGAALAGHARRLAHDGADGAMVELAEPVVCAAACARCGPTAATRAILGKPARVVSENAMFCFGCGGQTVSIELSEFLALEELEGELATCAIPVAFVRVGTHLLDLTPAPPGKEIRHG